MNKELKIEEVNAIIITNGIIQLLKNSQLSYKQIKIIKSICEEMINI